MRHCERSEAIQVCARGQWIASSQGLLAMTGKQQYVMACISIQAETRRDVIFRSGDALVRVIFKV